MFEKRNERNFFVVAGLICALAFSAAAQSKRKTVTKKNTKKPAAAKKETIADDAANSTNETKKNSRPETEAEQNPPIQQPTETKKNNARPAAETANPPVYFYEFSQPNFVVSKIIIEHDENGKGKISLKKRDFADLETDPLQLSAATMGKLKAIFQALNFLDSTENYQYEKDYAHLGTMKFTLRRDGRERTAEFNYTANKDAKNLADEYRRIAQQFTWIFDINVARENQPLDAPRLMDSLDSLIRRNEVSDAEQMVSLLKELSNDERIPLISRNHAAKLIEKIEKDEKKK